jgi:hypothetical protein
MARVTAALALGCAAPMKHVPAWVAAVDGADVTPGEVSIMAPGRHVVRLRWRLVARGACDLPDGEFPFEFVAAPGGRYALRPALTHDAEPAVELYDEDDFSVLLQSPVLNSSGESTVAGRL